MKILVTGATSGLGRNAVQYLLNSGVDVIATGRNRQAGEQLTKTGATFIPLDLTQADVAACTGLMANCDAIWHCAAKSSPWGDQASFYRANVQATRILAEAAGRVEVPRFVHISTPAVYFDFQHHYDLPETWLARSFSSHYASSKYQAEQIIAAAVGRFQTTKFIILRPRGLFGPHDNVIVPRLIRQIKQQCGVLRLPRGGETLLDLTFVQNVTDAMSLATDASLLPSGSIYNVTNHQPLHLIDMLDMLLHQQLGLRYTVKSVPWPVVSMVSRGMELAGKLARKEPLITRYSAGTVCFDMTLSPQKAIQQLNYRPRISMEEGIALTGEWLRAHGKNY